MQVSRSPEFAHFPPPLFSTSSGRREFVKKILGGIRTISRGTKRFHRTNKTTVHKDTGKKKAVKKALSSKAVLKTTSMVHPFQKGKGHKVSAMAGVGIKQDGGQAPPNLPQVFPHTQSASGKEAQESCQLHINVVFPRDSASKIKKEK